MSYIDISTVMVRQTHFISAAGASTIVHEPPLRVFLLELVEADGRANVWDGLTYLDALDAASDWAADDVGVRDRVAETWGRT